MAVYVISDTHFGHENILKFERRNFKTIQEHDEYIISLWNKTIHKTDTVYHLGDVGLTKTGYLETIIPRLNGYKILIMGNHDRKGCSKARFERMGFNEVHPEPVYYTPKVLLSHEPSMEALNNPFVINIHGHLHCSKLSLDNFYNVNCFFTDYKPVRIDKYVRLTETMPKREEKFLEEWYAKYYVFTNTTERNDVITDEDGHIQYENTLKYRFSKSIDYDGEIVVDNIVSIFEDDKIVKYVVKETLEDSIIVKNHKVSEKKLLLSDRNYLWFKTVRIKNDFQED